MAVTTGPARFERLSQKPYTSQYFYVETVINQRVELIWPHALRIGNWMTDHRLETVAGEPGEIGYFERVYPSGIAADVPQPHYILYGIAEIIPFKCIALEVFPEKGGSLGDTTQWTSLDSILFSDLDGRTRVTFLQVHMTPNGNRTEGAHPQQSTEGQDTAFRERLNRYFDNLRRLVGGDA